MSISIINGPTIDINTRSSFAASHFYNEIREIWSGYRTCYYKNVDWEDARPFPIKELDKPLPEGADTDHWLADEAMNKKWHALCDAFINDAVNCFSLQRNIARDFGYRLNSRYLTTEDDDSVITNDFAIRDRATWLINSMVNAVLKREQSDNPETDRMGALEWFRMINACKSISDKLKRGHESPFEHGVVTYTLHNVSRSLTHQLVRCRLASYSQASQRYIGEDPSDLSVVLPVAIRNRSDAANMVMRYFEKLPELITELKKLGIKNEDIRCIYPNAMPTDIKVTMNFRELKHFFELRISKHAQDEIRLVAFDLWTAMCNCMPFIWTNAFTYLTFKQ